jgi:hypothetical protein
MGEHRFLENKFHNEIVYHLNNALPYLKDFTTCRISTSKEDSSMSFDLVFGLELTISIRIRKNRYLKFKDLTIRSRSKNDYDTEIDKISYGYSQIYFYAYMNEAETELIDITIVDVNCIRALYEDKKYKGPYRNGDGTELIGFNFADISNINGELYKYKNAL